MTAPHDTQRREDERLFGWRCPECGLLSSRVHCEGDGLTVEHPAREAEPIEVAPVQSEGERFPLYVLDADGNVAPALAVTDEMVERAAQAIDDAAMGGLDGYRNEDEDRLPNLARAALEAAFNSSPPTTQEARADG